MDFNNYKRNFIHRRLMMIFAISLCTVGTLLKGEDLNQLPRAEILGQEYFVYEVKKNESIYGVAKKFNWNLEELARVNPDANGYLQKGTKLYYPTGNVSIVTQIPEPKKIKEEDLEPIKHKVKKGETIYSISREYGVPLDIIYNSNPSAKKGVKTGEILTIPQSPNEKYYYYTIKRNDSLSEISAKFNTTVEDIVKANNDLSVENLNIGEIIRIPLNSNVSEIKTRLIPNDVMVTESGNAEIYGISETILQSSENNDGVIYESSILETYEPNSFDNLKEEDIQKDELRIALILDEPSSKKDIDFTRGFLVALQKFEHFPGKLNLKVIDGGISASNLVDTLEDYEPSLVISTADKTFPLVLADYGNTNNTQIVNVFDLKNDLYEENPSLIQILPPTTYFNEIISNRIYNINPKRKFVFVGEKDENDGIASKLAKLYEDNHEYLSLEEFGSYEPDISENLLIYSYANKKEDVSDFLNNVETLFENTGANFTIVGRQSWIAMTDDFGDKFSDYSIAIPSRVYIDEEAREWKEFNDNYESLFDTTPVRSIPNFALSGYDIGVYFIPLIKENQGDFSILYNLPNPDMIQNTIELRKINEGGGYVNETGYIIKFTPEGRVKM